MFGVIMDRKVIDKFTTCIFRVRGKPLAVVNVEITKYDDSTEM